MYNCPLHAETQGQIIQQSRKCVHDIQILTKAGIDRGLSVTELLVQSYTV